MFANLSKAQMKTKLKIIILKDKVCWFCESFFRHNKTQTDFFKGLIKDWKKMVKERNFKNIDTDKCYWQTIIFIFPQENLL
jgi:thioredoxin-related protein